MNDSIRLSSKAALIEAAFDMLIEKPNASLADIAERAGVGRATLHRHFSGRDDLILTLARTAISEMDAAADAACADTKSYGEALHATLKALIPLGDRYRFLMREPAEDDPEIAAEYARQMDETLEMVEAAKGEGLFDPSIPTGWIVQAYDHLLYAGWESVREKETTPNQAADLAWHTLTQGLGVNRK